MGSWLPSFWSGTLITIQLTLVSGILVILISTGVAIASLSKWRWIRVLARVYIELFRSIPMLAILFIIYYGCGRLLTQIGVSAFGAAVIGFVIVEGAYTAEVYRSAILSVRKGQWDVATSLGMSTFSAYCFVILPQSLNAALPPTVNMFIYLLQATALASLINVSELTYHATSLIAETFEPLKIFMIITAIYLCLTVPLGYLGRWLETKVHRQFGVGDRAI